MSSKPAGRFKKQQGRAGPGAGRPRVRALALLCVILAGLVLLPSCGGGSVALSVSSDPPAPQFPRVFLLVMENMRYSDVIGSASMPYLNSLASRSALSTNFFANTHPSIGNYFMLTTGQIITNDNQFAGPVTENNLVRELTAAGRAWKAYAEDLPAVGYTGGDANLYVKRHNPFAYFSDVTNNPVQAENLVPFSQFSADLSAGRLPAFVYLLPNDQHNMHDCPPGMSTCTLADRQSYGDDWLRANLEPLLASDAMQGSVLIVTFDESDATDSAHGGGQVVTLLAGPRVKPGFRSSTLYQHQSLLRLIQEGLSTHDLLGAAAGAPRMSEFFN